MTSAQYRLESTTSWSAWSPTAILSAKGWQNGFDASRAMARDVMTSGIHCCREDDDLAKAVQRMETLKVRRLPVINKNKRMVGMLALGDVSTAAPNELVSECVKSVSAHHH